jgi:CubicO group peptidase (beta-lactamase class C family)
MSSARLSSYPKRGAVGLVTAMVLALLSTLVAPAHATTLRPVHATTLCPARATALSAPPAGGNATVALDTKVPTDPVELGAFFNKIVPVQLDTYRIPGATVSVVKDGVLLFAKGYGSADVANRIPVQADRTLFHIGSITKLFTWTAVMQLVEQGKLDLHADVNLYLEDFQIPATYPEPITLHHLLTHTPGFDDQLSNIFSFGPASLVSLDVYLEREMPTRVYRPGDIIAYSNYGAGLAGYIVEQVSGEPYEGYIENHILEPLGMAHSSPRQPVPPALAADEANGYSTMMREALETQEYLPNAPAGGISATAIDMAKFMLAHLQNGAYDGSRILQERTVQEMHRQHYTSDPRLSGFAYGFMEWDRNGQHILWHSGGTAVFFSMLMLLPEDNLGVFYSFNGTGGSTARVKLRQAFLDHYFPAQIAELHPLPDHTQRVSRYTGLYRESRFGFSTADKLFYAFSWVVEGSANPDGTLHYRDEDWIEVEPLVFRQVDGQGWLIFEQDARGNVIRAYQDIDPHEAQIRMAWSEDPMLLMAVGGLCLILFLSTLIGWPVAALVDRRQGRTRATAREARMARRLMAAISALHLLSPLWMGGTAAIIAVRNPLALMGSSQTILTVPLAFSFIAVILTAGAVVFTFLAWKNRFWGTLGRVHYTLVTLGALSFAGWLYYWNLLGWHF